MRRFAPAMVNSGRQFATSAARFEAKKAPAATEATGERGLNYINPAQVGGLVAFWVVTLTGIQMSGVLKSSH